MNYLALSGRNVRTTLPVDLFEHVSEQNSVLTCDLNESRSSERSNIQNRIFIVPTFISYPRPFIMSVSASNLLKYADLNNVAFVR